MADQFDVIVIGMGPGGEVAASQLLRAGRAPYAAVMEPRGSIMIRRAAWPQGRVAVDA